MKYIATLDDIRAGKLTDVYFERTRRILEAEGIHRRVAAEFVVKSFPDRYSWGVFAGLESALELLISLPVDVWAMEEGMIFYPGEPTLLIEGDYLDFGLYETALLGFLCQASGIATKAARCRKAAGQRLLASFGARRMHPALAPLIDRNAYAGGCDGVAVVRSAELLNLKPTGTIPHALVLLMGDVVAATSAFDRVIEKEVPRVALVDTFGDEKFEALRVAETLGEALYGVRLDTPSSRRGDFLAILREVRWELDLRGFRHVKIFVSGGIDEYRIFELNEVADAYGVGTSISNAPVLDFAMDIVEIEGKPVAKRGKLAGRKQVWRCPRCGARRLLPWSQQPDVCTCGNPLQPLLTPLLQNGRLVRDLPTVHAIRQRVLEELERVELSPDR
ncbi:MAG: nicotinate phosphoribosyltransferase [candidate division KSB1 bacterium]|nr:nicotinate phosphoribosyltransferase [candidate division KSB1 bacterium]